MSRQARWIAAGVAVVALVLIVIFLRPLLHGPLMWFWRTPLPWIVAAVILLIGRLAGGRAKLTVADLQAGRYPGRSVFMGSVIAAGIAFFALQAINPLLVQRSLSQNVVFNDVESLPDSGIVRLVPREVAEQVLSGSFNSSTESLTDLRVVGTPKGLQWSAIRTPEGAVRRLTKKSQGLLLLDAQNTTRTSEQVDAEMTYAPGLAVFDSLTWQLRKRNLLVDLTNPVGMLDAEGRPTIMVPYVKWTGFPIRRPVLGGTFLAHADGRIEDLSPDEARKRPEIVRSGRLYPDALARREHDAYALRGGIWNYLFLHENQTKITDTELNRQPYLLQGAGDTASWVSVAEPYGRSAATSAIFMTDSTTGRTTIWKVPEKTPLTGNARALRAVRSLTIPGVNFTNSDLRGSGSGGFRAVEPRPVFVKGKLYFLVSIIPDSANNVSKTVMIDAATNQSAGVFDNTNASGLQETLDFLKNGPKGGSDRDGDGNADGDAASAPEAPTEGGEGSGDQPAVDELRRRVEQAIQRQEQTLDDLRVIERELGNR